MSRPFASRATRAVRPVRPVRTGRPGSAPRRKPSLGVAAGVAFAVLTGALLLQQTLPRRSPAVDRLPADEAVKLLPPGALASQYEPLEVPDLPQSSYVVGYLLRDEPHAAYVRWNKEERAYRITATVALAGDGLGLQGQPKFTSLPLGTGAPVAVLARASLGASTDGVAVLLTEGDALRPAMMVNADGAEMPAVFPSGASATHSETIAFDDVDADGDADAVATAVTAADEERTVQVYVWQDGRFVHDQPLSWTLTMSSRVFPEPGASEPSAPEAGTETEVQPH